MARRKTLNILACPSSQLGCPPLLTELVLVAQALFLFLSEKTIGIMRSPYSFLYFFPLAEIKGQIYVLFQTSLLFGKRHTYPIKQPDAAVGLNTVLPV